MTPEEFRRLGHQLIDWLADYQEGLAQRPVMAKTRPGEIRDALPRLAARRAGGLRRRNRRSRPARPARAVALAASALLRLFPRQRAACGGARRPRQHRASACSASPGNRARRLRKSRKSSTDWLRQMLGLSACLQRRHSGHRLDQHAGGADLARASGRPTLRLRAAACKAKAESHASTCRRMRTARSTRARCSPDSAATTCVMFPTTTTTRCAPTRWRKWSPTTWRKGDLPCAIVATVGTTATTAFDPIAAIADVARAHGLWLHVDAAMAGSAMILPECRWMWDGIEGAD